MHHALHHLIKRKDKRNHNKIKSAMDKIIYIVIFAGLVMTLPQVIEIWGNKTASGVSLVSWAMLLTMPSSSPVQSLQMRLASVVLPPFGGP